MSLHRHHRKLRSQGGTDDSENVMLVTPEQHRWIHDHPAMSYGLGWMVKSWQEPSEVPIRGTWPLFACDVDESAGMAEEVA